MSAVHADLAWSDSAFKDAALALLRCELFAPPAPAAALVFAALAERLEDPDWELLLAADGLSSAQRVVIRIAADLWFGGPARGLSWEPVAALDVACLPGEVAATVAAQLVVLAGRGGA